MWIRAVLLFSCFLSFCATAYGAACSATIAQGSTESCDAITRNGITWTLAANETVGQFVNGDYWVVIDAGVSVASITGTNIAGTMKNPVPGDSQGYNSSASGYSAALNVSLSLPLAMAAGDILISTTSHTYTTEEQTYIGPSSILTFVSSAPASGAFRPGYCDTSRAIYNESSLNYDALADLTAVGSPPDLSATAALFENVWIDHRGGWTARQIHPDGNMRDYGAEVATDISMGALLLNCNFTDVQKRDLLINFVQLGIDLYSIFSVDPGLWEADGGHGIGRKAAIILAAQALGNSTMLAAAGTTSPHPYFAEDEHTFYIDADDWSRTVCGDSNGDCSTCTTPCPTCQYNSVDHPIGTAEWGIRHWYDGVVSVDGMCEAKDDSRCSAPYRVYYSVITGGLLAAKAMGLQDDWNWNAAFDYMERHRTMMPDRDNCLDGGAPTEGVWAIAMYDTYWTACAAGACLGGAGVGGSSMSGTGSLGMGGTGAARME